MAPPEKFATSTYGFSTVERPSKTVSPMRFGSFPGNLVKLEEFQRVVGLLETQLKEDSIRHFRHETDTPLSLLMDLGEYFFFSKLRGRSSGGET